MDLRFDGSSFSYPGGDIYVTNESIAYCLVNGSPGGLIIIDVSDPETPTKIGEIALAGVEFVDVEIDSGIAYVSGGVFFNPPAVNPVLTILDVSDNSDPQVLYTLEGNQTRSYVFDVEVEGNRVFLTDTSNSMTILDVQDPSLPTELVSIMPAPGFTSISDFELSNGLVYQADASGLSIYDFSDPEAPLFDFLNPSDAIYQGGLSTPWFGLTLGINQSHLFLSTHELFNNQGRVYLLDLSDPINPVEIGFIDYPDFIGRLHSLGDLLLFNPSSQTAGLVAYDISDLENPSFAAQYSPMSQADENGYLVTNFELVGDVVYTVGEFGLEILRIDGGGMISANLPFVGSPTVTQQGENLNVSLLISGDLDGWSLEFSEDLSIESWIEVGFTVEGDTIKTTTPRSTAGFWRLVN